MVITPPFRRRENLASQLTLGESSREDPFNPLTRFKCANRLVNESMVAAVDGLQDANKDRSAHSNRFVL